MVSARNIVKPCATAASIGLGKFRFKCECIIDGVPVNPVLPPRFDDTANEIRPDRHLAWWGVPFVVTHTDKGTRRFVVRCLDGGAWDRSTWWGEFPTVQAAVALAKKKTPPWRQ